MRRRALDRIHGQETRLNLAPQATEVTVGRKGPIGPARLKDESDQLVRTNQTNWSSEPVARRITDVDEVVALWAAHERGDVDSEDHVRVLPRGLENYRATLIGLTARAQVHAWVSGLRGGHHYPGYRLAYPVLWWLCFRDDRFDARMFLRVNRQQWSPSKEAAMLEIGYEGRNPSQVLNLFLGLIERSLESSPLDIEPMVEAPCGIEIADAIARQVSEEVDSKGDGLRTF